MKKLNVLYLFLALTIVLGSCGNSNNVVSNRLISKRKFNKGFHINKKGNFKDSKQDVASEDLKADDATSTDVKLKPNRIARKQAKANVESTVASYEYESEEIAEVVSYTENQTIESADSDLSSDGELTEDSDLKTESNETESNEELEDIESLKSGLQSAPSSSDPVMLIVYILLCLILPPVAIAIYSGITGIFWLDLILFLLAISSFFWLPTVGLVGLAAVVIAFLVVFDVI